MTKKKKEVQAKTGKVKEENTIKDNTKPEKKEESAKEKENTGGSREIAEETREKGKEKTRGKAKEEDKEKGKEEDKEKTKEESQKKEEKAEKEKSQEGRKKEGEKVNIVSEDVYTIPLKAAYRTKPDYKRTRKAIQLLLSYLRRHTKSTNIRIDSQLNKHIWRHGASRPPRKIQIKAVKDSEGRVTATLLQ